MPRVGPAAERDPHGFARARRAVEGLERVEADELTHLRRGRPVLRQQGMPADEAEVSRFVARRVESEIPPQTTVIRGCARSSEAGASTCQSPSAASIAIR